MLAVCVASGWGCGGRGADHPDPQEAFESLSGKSPETVAATVNGDPIGLDAFQRYWNRHPTMNREAVVEAVLERHVIARRALRTRKRAAFRALGYVRKRGLVQHFLRTTIEAEITEETLDEEKLEKAKDRARRKRGRPPGLKASHILVMLPKPVRKKKAPTSKRERLRSTAETWIRRLDDHLSASASVEDLYAALQQFEGRVPSPLKLVVNARLTFPRPDEDRKKYSLPDGWRRVVPAFADASERLAEAKRFDELSDPVESRFGWHLILVHETLPPRTPDSESLREVAVESLLRTERTRRLQKYFNKTWRRGMTFATYPEALAQRGEEGRMGRPSK